MVYSTRYSTFVSFQCLLCLVLDRYLVQQLSDYPSEGDVEQSEEENDKGYSTNNNIDEKYDFRNYNNFKFELDENNNAADNNIFDIDDNNQDINEDVLAAYIEQNFRFNHQDIANDTDITNYNYNDDDDDDDGGGGGGG